MDISIYAGPCRTASQHIYNVIEQNASMIKDQGIAVIPYYVQLPALKKATEDLANGTDKEKVYETYIKSLIKDKNVKRMVILDHRLSGSVLAPVRRSLILPTCGKSLLRLSAFLPEGKFKYFMAARNLTTFLPSCYGSSLINAKIQPFEEFIDEIEIEKARWSEAIFRIINRIPNNDPDADYLITWRFEDYPKIWRDVVGAITGVENHQDLIGTSDLINEGLTLYGSQLMYSYLQKHKPKEPGDFQKIKTAFLEKFGSKLGVASDPFWSESDIADVTYAYEDDWYYIERMDNVATISARPVY